MKRKKPTFETFVSFDGSKPIVRTKNQPVKIRNNLYHLYLTKKEATPMESGRKPRIDLKINDSIEERIEIVFVAPWLKEETIAKDCPKSLGACLKTFRDKTYV